MVLLVNYQLIFFLSLSVLWFRFWRISKFKSGKAQNISIVQSLAVSVLGDGGRQNLAVHAKCMAGQAFHCAPQMHQQGVFHLSKTFSCSPLDSISTPIHPCLTFLYCSTMTSSHSNISILLSKTIYIHKTTSTRVENRKESQVWDCDHGTFSLV